VNPSIKVHFLLNCEMKIIRSFIAELEFEFLKDKTFRDSLKNDLLLINPLNNQTKNYSRNRVLFELKNSINEEEKNFIEINKKIATQNIKKKPKMSKSKEPAENFELQIYQSKISKNMKSVLELVLSNLKPNNNKLYKKKSKELRKYDFFNYDPTNKEYQCMACLKRHRSQRKHCKSFDFSNSFFDEKSNYSNIFKFKMLIVKSKERI